MCQFLDKIKSYSGGRINQAFIIFNFISLISYIDARISELEQRLQNLFEAVSGQPGISSKVQTLESEVSDIKVR